MENCTCAGTSYGNMGPENCPVIGATPHNIILMNRYDENGDLNKIDLTSPTLGVEIQSMILSATPWQERLFPFPFAETFNITKTDPVYDTKPSGNKYLIKQGIRSFEMELTDKNASTRMLEQAMKFGCSALSYFIVDIEGKIEGYKTSEDSTDFYPIPMSQSTFNAMLNYATDTTVQTIKITFDQSQYFNDGSLYYLTASDLGYSATELVGLKSATQVATTPTTTSVTLTVTKPAGSALTPSYVVGLVSANFALYDVTGSAAVPVLTCTESSDGVYVLTYAAVTGANTFRSTVTANGYDIPVITYADPA